MNDNFESAWHTGYADMMWLIFCSSANNNYITCIIFNFDPITNIRRRCDMQVPRKALNGRHLGTAQCAKGAEAAGRDGDEGELGAGVPRLQKTNGGGFGVPVPQAASDGNGR